MIIESEFEVAADPDRVFAYLVDVERVVTCVPGAELDEALGDGSYEGRVKIKVGAVTVKYKGEATILERDATVRRAVLRANGKEAAGGGGSAQMSITLGVSPSPNGSIVRLETDLTITGRVASFGRSIVEDVSRRLIGQMTDCVKRKLESAPDAAAAGDASPPSGEGQPDREAADVQAINGLSLILGVFRDRLRRLLARIGSGRKGRGE